VDCTLYTCNYVDERRKKKTHALVLSPHLAGPDRAGRGMAWCGDGRMMCA
jgi:hypothetical protein